MQTEAGPSAAAWRDQRVGPLCAQPAGAGAGCGGAGHSLVASTPSSSTQLPATALLRGTRYRAWYAHTADTCAAGAGGTAEQARRQWACNAPACMLHACSGQAACAACSAPTTTAAAMHPSVACVAHASALRAAHLAGRRVLFVVGRVGLTQNANLQGGGSRCVRRCAMRGKGDLEPSRQQLISATCSRAWGTSAGGIAGSRWTNIHGCFHKVKLLRHENLPIRSRHSPCPRA